MAATALRVGVLAYPGCFAAEVYGVTDLLSISNHVAAGMAAVEAPFAVSVVSPRRRVVADGGFPLGVAPVGPLDLCVVPGFPLVGSDLDDRLASLGPELALLRGLATHGTAVASICVGAFLLGAAGLLDGRRSTTSWLLADRLAERVPATTVCPDRLVVTDGPVTTTAAFTAMFDLAVGLARSHAGDRVARLTSRIALLEERSSQAPYVDPALLPAPGQAFADRVRRWLDQNLAEPYDLDRLAARFGVSSRTLLRRFRAETGTTPLGHLQHARVRRAQRLLETSDLAIGQVCTRVGYADPATFGRLFRRHAGMTPAEYRRRFARRTGIG
jgi:transcriptional regulator GlxA family with amidase domain